ncbi:MAG: amino acid permease [Chitinophagaceae bacterium]|nr:amino acid permease [Chitinophagaceae bacterium]
MSSNNRPLLSLFDLTMIVVSLVIGMGIFRTPHDVAHASGTPLVFFAAWVFGGIIALFGALTFAEIGSRYPVTGGFYKIYSYCYHPAIAFMINCIILISNAASVSAVALIGAGYLEGLIEGEQSEYFKQSVALGAVIVFFFVNFLGFKMSVKTQNVLMMAKIGILLFICLGVFIGTNGSAALESGTASVAGQPDTMDLIRMFGVALIAVSFSYGGYQQTINFGGEVANPQRTIPRAIFFGIAIIVGFYLMVNFAYFRVLGFEGIQLGKNDLAARHAQQMFGGYAYQVMSFLLFFSVLGYVNIGLMSNPRVMYAMAEDKVLPAALMRMNQRQVLTVSLPIFAAVAVLTLVFSREFEKILDRVIFLDSIGLATAVGSIFILRRKTKHLDESGAKIYKMKLYPLMPIVYILAYLFVSVSIVIKDPWAGLLGAGLLGFFYIMYRVGKWRNAR